MLFKIAFVMGVVLASCSPTIVKFNDLKCKQQQEPANGKLECSKRNNTQNVFCELTCNPGYDVAYLAAREYICNTDGKWTTNPQSADLRWPDCKVYGLGEPVP